MNPSLFFMFNARINQYFAVSMYKINFLSFQEQITYTNALFIIFILFVIICIYSALHKITLFLPLNISICSSEEVAGTDHL